MKTWQRARIDELCGGGCGRRVAVDEPILVVELPQLSGPKRRRIRCTACAGEAVDEGQLEAFDVRDEAQARPRFDFTGHTRPLAFDAKAAAAGERDE